MRVWVAAVALGGDAFDRTLPEMTSDAVRSKLHETASLILHPRDDAELNRASKVLASATRSVGLDYWTRFATAAAAAMAAVAASPALRGAVIGFEEGAALGVETAKFTRPPAARVQAGTS